jgi:hypothetical protein
MNSRLFMRKTFLLVCICFLAACTRETWYITPSGLHYHIFYTNGRDSVARMGGVAKVRYIELFHGAIRKSTGGQLPLYQHLIPGMLMPYGPMEALVYGVREGDSVEVVQRLDSMVGKGLLPKLPPGTHGSDEITTRLVVERVFAPDLLHPGRLDSLVRADKEQEAAVLLTRERPMAEARVTDWLRQQGIKATATAYGTFIQVLELGKGPVADSGSVVSIRYSCTTLAGKILDANTDTSFHHPPVLAIRLGARMLPPALDQTMRGLHSGSHVKIFVPKGVGVMPAMVAQQGQIPGEDVVWELWM